MVILFRKASKRIDKLEAENFELKKQIEELKSNNAALKESFEELKKVCDGLKLDIDNLRDDGITSPQQLIREYFLGDEGGSNK